MTTLKRTLNPKLTWHIYRRVLTPAKAQGFTMLEVLAAMMIAFAFLMGTLNAMLAATMMQVKAERQAAATYWIQQDLENIRALAANADTYTTTSPTAACSGTPSSCCTTTISGSTVSGGFANKLNSALSTPGSRNLLNKSYTMTRSTSVNTSAPQVLRMTYTVQNASDPDAIATLYTEVLPPPALSC